MSLCLYGNEGEEVRIDTQSSKFRNKTKLTGEVQWESEELQGQQLRFLWFFSPPALGFKSTALHMLGRRSTT